MNDSTKHTTPRTLAALALALAALLALAAVPCATAPADQDRMVSWDAEIQQLSETLGEPPSDVRSSHRGVIDPNGQKLAAADTGHAAPAGTIEPEPRHRGVIDPNGVA